MIVEALWAYLASETFWLLFGMTIGSFLITFFSFLYGVGEACDTGFGGLPWYRKLTFIFSVLITVFGFCVFIFSILYLFAGAGIYFERYNG